MNDPVAVIDAFDKWWNTRPEPHISSPKQAHMKMQQERMLAIWLSAWDACEKHKAQAERQIKELTEGEIVNVWHEYQGEDRRPFVNFARAILERAQEK